jgi:uncharacterized sporulation protein YeaH/YhbH (DUF444 family)
MGDDILMREPTTLDDVLKEVRELREEVNAYRKEIARLPERPVDLRFNAVNPLDARGTTEGKISLGLS